MCDLGELTIGVYLNPNNRLWYWWSCDPATIDDEEGGILPSGDNIGPFPTSKAAWADVLTKSSAN